MSEDGFSDSFDEPNIEIQIKTLMGTTFDIKVSSNDTVSDIKKKISRVEGIPVYQQNLIFQSEELKDTTRLCDTGIRNGSTLTLISAMRGGPISTRRLSVTCEHYLLKELKDLLENTRDEMTPGSKVSVLVFKEGDIINLLRVIENEDGSYSPYNESPISPPSKPSRRDTLEAFERLVEDTEMCTKIATLRKKMEELNIKKQTRLKQTEDSLCKFSPNTRSNDKLDPPGAAKGKTNFSYRFLEECAEELLDNVDLTVFEKNLDEGNQSESEEIALKDKHRTKAKGLQSLPVPKPNTKSLYSERKGSYSHTRQNYAKIAKRREPRLFEKAEKNPGGYISFSRDRPMGTSDFQKSSLLDNKTSYSKLPSLGTLDDRLDGILPNSNILGNDAVDRLALPNDHSENPYLLEGLNSNRLPDLRILDTDDLLAGGLEDTRSMLGDTGIGDDDCSIDPSTFLNLPMLNKNNSVPMSNSSRVLPELSSISSRTFGPLLPDIGSNNTTTLGGRISNPASLVNSLPLATSYSLPSVSKLSQSHSLESSSFPSVELPGSYSKLPQTSSYSLASTNKLSQSNNTLDNPLSNLTRLENLGNLSSSRGESPILGATGGTSVEEVGAKLAEQLHLLDEEPKTDMYGESFSVPTRNRVHLTRLVLASEGAERPKSSPDSIELEEHAQDIWEIHEPASERLKHSATCKVGLLKRRQGVEYNYDSLDNSQPNLKPELGNLSNYSKSSTEFGVCSGANFYMPQYLSSPSAIPPQYAPKHHPKYCDLFFRNEPRSPLYSRRNRKENLDIKEEKYSRTSANFDGDCSSIQRLKNDENLFGPKEEFNTTNEDLFGYYSLGCASDLLEKVEENKEVIKLPPVIKKKSRCNECNKRLNITNIYNCRCGRIFCSQHRYSEVHRCTYDYKTEGRKILERQNPLVTAEKVQRF